MNGKRTQRRTSSEWRKQRKKTMPGAMLRHDPARPIATPPRTLPQGVRIGSERRPRKLQQPAARSTEKTSGGTTADAAPHGACDEVKSEADTLSALRAQVVSAIERNDGADFQAALAANPKQVHTEAAASQAAEATSPTMVASPSPLSAQEDLNQPHQQQRRQRRRRHQSGRHRRKNGHPWHGQLDSSVFLRMDLSI